MSKIWKLKNTSNQKVTIAIKKSSSASKGVLLEPGQFCLSEAQMTSSLDAQMRRRFIVKADEDFDNSKLNLVIGDAYDESAITVAMQEVTEVTK